VKALLSGFAFTILLIFFNVFQIDQDTYIRSQEYIKVLADDAAAGAALFYDESAFSNGLNVYDTAKSEAVVKNLIQNNLKLADDLSPLEPSYWDSGAEYITYYFDDSKTMKTYENGVYISQSAFNYNTLFNEPLTDYKKLITEPTVIVTIAVTIPRNRSAWIDWPQIVRSSAYENLDRD